MKTAAVILAIGIAALSPGLVSAQPFGGVRHEAQYRGGGGARISIDQAISRVRAIARGGRLLDAGMETWRGRPVYRVRWATADGRRIDFIVDAESGAIIGEED